MYFTSKADTLAELEGKRKYACVLPQFSFTSKMWNAADKDVDLLWNDRPKWADGFFAPKDNHIIGKNSKDIKDILGYEGRDELIHKDDLVKTI